MILIVQWVFQLREDTTRGHSKKIFKKKARLDKEKQSLPNEVVDKWNGLPE